MYAEAVQGIEIAHGVVVLLVDRNDDGVESERASGVSRLRHIDLRRGVIGQHLLGVVGVVVIDRVSLLGQAADRVRLIQTGVGEVHIREGCELYASVLLYHHARLRF